MAIPDLDLVRGALAGDEQACRCLVLTYQRPIYSLLLRMVRDPALAEDLAQETFLKAFRKLRTFDPERKLSSWLFKIAHNTALDHLRRGAPETVSLEPVDDEAADHRPAWEDQEAAPPDELVLRKDLAAAIEAAIGELPPRYREIISMRYQEDLAYQDIAEILALPMGTVKTHIHRARQQLMAALVRRGFRPAGGGGETPAALPA